MPTVYSTLVCEECGKNESTCCTNQNSSGRRKIFSKFVCPHFKNHNSSVVNHPAPFFSFGATHKLRYYFEVQCKICKTIHKVEHGYWGWDNGEKVNDEFICCGNAIHCKTHEHNDWKKAFPLVAISIFSISISHPWVLFFTWNKGVVDKAFSDMVKSGQFKIQNELHSMKSVKILNAQLYSYPLSPFSGIVNTGLQILGDENKAEHMLIVLKLNNGKYLRFEFDDEIIQINLFDDHISAKGESKKLESSHTFSNSFFVYNFIRIVYKNTCPCYNLRFNNCQHTAKVVWNKLSGF